MPSNTNEPGTEDRSYAALDPDVDDLRKAQNLIRHVAYRRRLVTPGGSEQSRALDAIADCIYSFLFGLVPDEAPCTHPKRRPALLLPDGCFTCPDCNAVFRVRTGSHS
jgi:hypothetical protein